MVFSVICGPKIGDDTAQSLENCWEKMGKARPKNEDEP